MTTGPFTADADAALADGVLCSSALVGEMVANTVLVCTFVQLCRTFFLCSEYVGVDLCGVGVVVLGVAVWLLPVWSVELIKHSR